MPGGTSAVDVTQGVFWGETESFYPPFDRRGMRKYDNHASQTSEDEGSPQEEHKGQREKHEPSFTDGEMVAQHLMRYWLPDRNSEKKKRSNRHLKNFTSK